MATTEVLVQALEEIIAPLVEADGGELYLVLHEGDEMKLHLAGTCSGCPGAALTSRGVISPTLRAVNPQLRVVVTTGYLIPEGSQRIRAAERMALVALGREAAAHAGRIIEVPARMRGDAVAAAVLATARVEPAHEAALLVLDPLVEVPVHIVEPLVFSPVAAARLGRAGRPQQRIAPFLDQIQARIEVPLRRVTVKLRGRVHVPADVAGSPLVGISIREGTLLASLASCEPLLMLAQTLSGVLAGQLGVVAGQVAVGHHPRLGDRHELDITLSLERRQRGDGHLAGAGAPRLLPFFLPALCQADREASMRGIIRR